MTRTRDHGGGVDAAIARWGGARADWIDLSTGINPVPYALPPLSPDLWTALPDAGAQARLITAARRFWRVPDGADILAAPGASVLIARMPDLAGGRNVWIPQPTYNEHAAAFAAAGYRMGDRGAEVHVHVHPNNPDGRLWPLPEVTDAAFTVIDESFCDVTPDASHVGLTPAPGIVVLKSFGKFWGLAGLRLGFAIGAPDLIGQLREALGPWPVSGPALAIGAAALEDAGWALATRARLEADARRLDALMAARGATVAGGTALFRLYDVGQAEAWHDRLARARILSRVFPYSGSWLRLGLPGPHDWSRLETALDGIAP